MKKLFLLILVTFSLTSVEAHELDQTALQAQSDILETVLDAETMEVFRLHTIAVLTRVEMSIDIPWIANLKVMPEIELHWTR